MSQAAETLQPRLVLDRYRPVRPLGTGGSGSVWLARDERTGLDVALKIVPREGKAAARAEREAEAAARLRHSRCQRAYALGHDESHVYIAYEYVPGRTLREAMRAGALDDRVAVEAAAQVLDGLAHAHARGIFHRDVKPSNVLLADGDGVAVKLLDFGLAVIAEEATLTASGDVPGTLGYIAPERLAGAEATPASDVWAVGVMLWEILAGEHPFWRPSPLESARAIEHGAPPLGSVRPDLPGALLAAVDAALARSPARRPSAAELALLLRDAFQGRRRTGGRRRGGSIPAAALAGRAAPAALAGATVGLTVSALPFYPPGWAAGLAALAAAAAAWHPRAGLGLALALPVLPLGNVSLGLALAYAALAAGWFTFFAGEPRFGLLPVVGALLGPLGAIGLLPLAVQPLRSPARRAFAAAAGFVAAVVAAMLAGEPAPLAGDEAPGRLGIAGSDAPLAVARTLWHVLADRPTLLVLAAALGAAGALLPHARTRGPWGIAGFGAGLLGVTLLPAPDAHALPLVVTTWLTCGLLAALALRELDGTQKPAR
jgi:hypothetical protein